MTERVKEILSWYQSDNPGTLTNLARILNHGRLAGTGKFVILPVDQGFEHGPARSFAPNPPAYDPRYHFQLAIDALSRADISISEMVRGMSGAFAVRTVPGAREAIDRFSQRRTELRRLVREQGDDPPEIKNWSWANGGSAA